MSIEDKGTPFWRVDKSNGRHKRVGKFGIDLGERGIYDKRNTLNDLTGKEWTYFTNSIWITAYPPTAGKVTSFDLRKVHPSPKPPELMRDLIMFFTKGGQTVFDPFAGVGGTLLGASMIEPKRTAIGIELEKRYVDAYRNVCNSTGLIEQTMILDDARNMLDHSEISETEFDLILTDPP